MSHFACMMLLLLCSLLLPKLLLLFLEKAAGQLNLKRCRTVLHVGSASTLSSSCLSLPRITQVKMSLTLSTRTILLQLWRRKKSCLLFFASICQHRHIRECFLPAPSVHYCHAIVHIQEKMHRFSTAMPHAQLRELLTFYCHQIHSK